MALKDKAKTEPMIISADNLCVLTELSDRRHRQLASDGYFPKPIRGRYQFVPTIQGILRFYRQQAQVSLSDEQIDRRTRLQADLLQIQKDEAEQKLIPIAAVDIAWEYIIVNLRSRIWHHQKLSKEVKRELLAELRRIPLNEYVEPREPAEKEA